MRLLLDTHAAVWWWTKPAKLGRTASRRLQDPSSAIYFSAASGYEIALKVRLGKMELPEPLVRDLETCVIQEAWRLLPISVKQAEWAGGWGWQHLDPFDRLLAAQALIEGMTLVTRDPVFNSLSMATLW